MIWHLVSICSVITDCHFVKGPCPHFHNNCLRFFEIASPITNALPQKMRTQLYFLLDKFQVLVTQNSLGVSPHFGLAFYSIRLTYLFPKNCFFSLTVSYSEAKSRKPMLLKYIEEYWNKIEFTYKGNYNCFQLRYKNSPRIVSKLQRPKCGLSRNEAQNIATIRIRKQ